MTEYLSNIIKRLRAAYQRSKLLYLVSGLLSGITLTILLFFLLIVAESFFNFSTEFRTLYFNMFIWVFLFAIIFTIGFTFYTIFKRLGSKDYFEIAKKIGAYFPQVKDKLVNAIQIYSEKEKSNYSKDLIDASFKSIYEEVAGIEFNKFISIERVKKSLRLLLFTAALITLIMLTIPSLMSSFNRLLEYDRDFVIPPKFVFEVSPGNQTLLKGRSIDISVRAKGDQPEIIFLNSKTASESEFTEKTLLKDSLGLFNFHIDNVKESFDYFAFSGEIISERFTISVINPPVIKNLSLTITPPAYTKMPEIVQKDNLNITGLRGSTAELKISATKKLSSGELIFKDSSKIMLELNNENGFAEFKIEKNDNYWIEIKDTDQNRNINPIIYSIKVLEDQFPMIKVISPEGDLKIVGNEQLPVILQISDDYGFSKLLLHHRLSASQFDLEETDYTNISIPISKIKTEDEVYFIWNLKELYLAVEDVISFYFEIFDNDNVSGPKSTKSELFTLRVPSIDEIFEEADNVQNESREELVETLMEAEKLKDEIQKISDELKKDDRQITWEEKEKIQNSISQFKELESKVKDIQQKLSETQEELERNDLLSEETMQMYEELQNLMDELASEEMKEAMERLQKMMEQMNRNQTQNSFEDFKMNEEAFKKSLERTVNLLKRIQIEQKVDELVKRTQEIADKESDLQNETEESDLNDQKQNENLQEKQSDVTKDLKKLQEELEDLKEKMSELDDMPQEDMEKMMEEMSKQQNQELSEETKKKMQQMQKMQAMQKQQQISKNMSQMNQMMMQMQQQMQMQNQMQVLTEMMKMINETLELSKEQEELKEITKSLPPNSEDYNKIAEQQEGLQQQLQNIMEQMAELAQKTFAISPEMAKNMNDAMRKMLEAQSAMHNRNSPLASQSQGGAMEGLNKAASSMKSQMEGMMNPTSAGGGMMSLMQQLQNMSQQQMGLNKLTQAMNQGGGQLTQQQMGELQRLAQEQEMIQKSLSELNREAKESGLSKKLSVNLDEILNDLREVVTGMKTEKIDDELVRAQERILSKMLDAQRSINERDFEKRRESQSGNTYSRTSPEALNLSSKENIDKIRAELMKLGKEGYTKDYEELIRKYFEALEKEGKN